MKKLILMAIGLCWLSITVTAKAEICFGNTGDPNVSSTTLVGVRGEILENLPAEEIRGFRIRVSGPGITTVYLAIQEATLNTSSFVTGAVVLASSDATPLPLSSTPSDHDVVLTAPFVPEPGKIYFVSFSWEDTTNGLSWSFRNTSTLSPYSRGMNGTEPPSFNPPLANASYTMLWNKTQELTMCLLTSAEPTPMPTRTATATPTPNPTMTSSPTPSPTSTQTPSPTPTPTATSEITPTPTVGPTIPPTPIPTATVIPSTGTGLITVWYGYDTDHDGRRGDDEPGIAYGTVELMSGNNIVAHTQTDLYGRGLLNNVPPGTYQVRVNKMPEWLFSAPNIGDETGDSDIITTEGIHGYTAEITLEANEISRDKADALVYDWRIPIPTATPTPTPWPTNQPTPTPSATPTPLGNNAVAVFVFNDANRNGVSDFESGVSGVQVSLIPLTIDLGSYSTIQFTDSAGAGTFAGLPDGTYQVQFGVPDGFVRTFPNQGVDDTLDSDANPINGFTHSFTLVGGRLNSTIWEGVFDESLLTPTPVSTPTATPVPTDEVNPVIISGPDDLTLFVGQNATFEVRDWPIDNDRAWSATLGDEPTQTIGTNSNTLNLPSATLNDQGVYQVEVSRTVNGNLLRQQSRFARLTVVERGLYNPANNAVYTEDTIPSPIIFDEDLPVYVEMRNDSPVTWSHAQGYALEVLNDPCNMFQGVRFIPIPEGVVVQPGQTWQFDATIHTPPNETTCNIQLQMVELGVENFGDVLDKNITIGWTQIIDGPALADWTYGNLGDEGPHGEATQQGLSMYTPPTGENLSGWFSPSQFLPLVDLVKYQINTEFLTDQVFWDSQPAMSIVVDNFPSNTVGNEFVFVVNTGWNGIRQGVDDGNIVNQNGLDAHEIQFVPNTAILPQWRGGFYDSNDAWVPVNPDNSAFATRAETVNDFRLVYRLLDIDSAGIKAEADYGAVMIKRITIEVWDLTSELPSDILSNSGVGVTHSNTVTEVYQRPINGSRFALGTYNQTDPALGGGPALYAQISNGARNAVVVLKESGPGARRTLFDWDPSQSTLVEKLFPIENRWYTGQTAIGIVDIEAAPGSYLCTDNVTRSVDPLHPNPPDVIGIQMDVVNIDLVTAANSIAAPDGLPMAYATTPRLRSQLGGMSQYYLGYLATNQAPLSEPMINQRYRLMTDIINADNLRPLPITGSDPTQINTVRIITPN